ncbi:NUDIX domain-containing protein [Candidimonas humi]|jgi:8-oxo-dGTP pyrophosphatase MutT (NUDIX family)|uniref:DUF4743 domain-containing protein n=1 Tax=Candidimonas humi TaxID=683355 RepID=A0ABV8NVM6_9BURK|nr:DUF4743 domain-containing protein [Candidimonas humi]MBV6304486.1 NUDIX domain-containing protein [Candidimonas humi]
MNHLPAGVPAQALQERQRKLGRQAQHLPPSGSRPLTVSGRVSGWITAKATQALAGLPGVKVEDEAVHITAASGQRIVLKAVLERVAQVLYDAGCARGWRNELLDVVGEGRRLSVIERAAMRPLGLLTRAVHLNAWTPAGELWIARRSMTKSTNPGMWDTLVGGLVGAGENLDDSLLRESHEEAGLRPAQLEARTPLHMITRMHRRLPEGYQVEDLLVSECVLPASAAPCNQDGEVSEIRSVPVEEAWAMVQAGEFTLEAELVIVDCLYRRTVQAA